jgi:hypothetical protein
MLAKNNSFVFIVLTFILLLVAFLFNYLINVNNLVYNFYSEQFAQEQIEQLLENKQKWSWVGYAIIPLLILIRTSLVAVCLSVGLFFYENEDKEPKFSQLFRVALVGEFILALVGFFKFFYFAFIKTEYTLQDAQQFYPFSYTNFLDISKIEPWLVYPLQTLNLFEIGYFFVLVYGLHKLLQNKYTKSFEIVAVSYGTGLLIWLGLVMFLTLNIT